MAGLPQWTGNPFPLGEKSLIRLSGNASAPSELTKQPIRVEPRRGGGEAQHRGITAPRPVLRLAYHPGAHRIQDHVAGEFEQIRLLLHQDRLVASLKQMTDQTVASIEALRVVPVQLAHPSGAVAVDGFHQQMIVVAHLAIGMHHPIEAATDVPEHLQPILPVGIPRKNSSRRSPREVIQRPGEFDSQRSSHGGIVAGNVGLLELAPCLPLQDAPSFAWRPSAKLTGEQKRQLL